MSVLRSKFGKVHVNLGQPIALDDLLAAAQPELAHAMYPMTKIRAPAGSAMPSRIWPRRINIEINAAAAVTPINLVAMAILATPRQALAESGSGAASSSCISGCCAMRRIRRW